MVGILNVVALLLPGSWYLPLLKPRPYEVHFDLARIYDRKHSRNEEDLKNE